MDLTNARVIPLKQAAEHFGAEKVATFGQATGKLGCLVKVAKIDFVT